MAGYTHDENIRDAAAAAAMFDALNTLPVPVIARVHGAAIGGGAGLAAVADIAVAEASATFGFTEVKLGLLPAIIAPYVLAKIGPSAARELFLTGRRFDASERMRDRSRACGRPRRSARSRRSGVRGRHHGERARSDRRGESAHSRDREPPDGDAHADGDRGNRACGACRRRRKRRMKEFLKKGLSRQSTVVSR